MTESFGMLRRLIGRGGSGARSAPGSRCPLWGSRTSGWRIWPTHRHPARARWGSSDRAEIVRRVSRGEVVFVDVTADRCLNC